MNQYGLPAWVLAILLILALAIVVFPAAVLYAYQTGRIGFEWSVLGLLVGLFYITVLGGGGGE